MPAPRQLPSSDTLRKHREAGMTYQDIADQYGVTKGAVYWQLKNAGVAADRPDHKKYLPWTVRTEHAHATPATMLRYLARREAGTALPEAKSRQLDKWLEAVREADVVVCYDRDQAPNPASPVTGGFYYSRRRESDGDSLIRFDSESSNPGTGNLPKVTEESR